MTQKLLSLWVRHEASIDGEASLQGQDLTLLDFNRFLNVVYYWATRNGNDIERRMFDVQLWVPPSRDVVPTEGPWSAEAETAAFRAVRSALGMKSAPSSPAVSSP